MASRIPAADPKLAETARTLLHILAGEQIGARLGLSHDQIVEHNTQAIRKAIEDAGFSTAEFFSAIGFLAAGTGEWKWCFLNDVELQERVGVADSNHNRWIREWEWAAEWLGTARQSQRKVGTTA